MLSLSNIYVQYSDRILLDSISVTIMNKEKIGLIGRNGAGKSTLFKIISGVQTPDTGNITKPNNTTIGYLHQEMNLPLGKTVMDETLTCFEALKKMEIRLEELTHLIETRTDYESDEYSNILTEHADLSTQYEIMGGGNMQANAERVLKGLGFKQNDFQRLTDEFSGGWKMRIELAKMLLSRPDYLLLDEPTNHLDIESILWLEGFLKDYPGVIITISHDKAFLDNVTKRTLEVELGNIYDYKAPYSKAMVLRKERREKLESSYKNQQKVIAQKERTINRFMAKATKTSLAQSMQKQLDKMERVEVFEEDIATMRINFQPAPRSGEIVASAENLTKSYGDTHVLDKINLQIERNERVSFVGQNGQGKTTLAKILIENIKATAGKAELGFNVKLGYYAQNQTDTLDLNKTLLQTMEDVSPPEMQTKLRKILGSFMFSGEDIDKKVVVLSGGERARLALACMMLRPINLLVMDEPTNHLDMLSKDVLKQAIMKYDGTLIIVSHDRDFLAGLTDKTIEFRDKKLYEHLGDIEYFLEKRKMANMREVELQKSAAAATAAASAKSDSGEDREKRKRFQRELNNVEKKIEKLETKIAKIETEMADPAFYESPDSSKKMEEYKKAKSDLDVAMANWEVATENVDSLG